MSIKEISKLIIVSMIYFSFVGCMESSKQPMNITNSTGDEIKVTFLQITPSIANQHSFILKNSETHRFSVLGDTILDSDLFAIVAVLNNQPIYQRYLSRKELLELNGQIVISK